MAVGQVEAELTSYRAANDWEGGLALLSVEHPARAHALSRNDWYRCAHISHYFHLRIPIHA